MVNPRAMSFKLNLSPASGFALPEHRIIHVQGRDAAAFLQAQLMNDVAALADGEWQYNGWLNAQGRVLALFQLAKLSGEHFLVVLPALPPEWLIDNLKRFVFRAKVRFSLEQNLFAQGEILPSEPAADAAKRFVGDKQLGYRLDMPNAPGNRRLHFQPAPGHSDAEAVDQWHCLDMAGGWLWIDETLQALWTPQMLSLQRLNAFSLKKGCYPGQEIVARTHYLGKSKRLLQALQGQGLVNGQAILQNGAEIGKVVNANLDGTFGVAVLPADLEPSALLANASGSISPIMAA
jgi:folate-binding protein YgfZ